MDSIKVTKVNFYRKEPGDRENIIANVAVEINGIFNINDISLVKSLDNNIKVFMPGRRKMIKDKLVRYNTVFFHDFANVLMIQEEVIKHYNYLRSVGKWHEDDNNIPLQENL